MLYSMKALGGKTMKKRKDSRIVLSILMVGVLLFSMFTITGCGKKTIVGVWVSESDGEKIYFNDDGTCDNMPYELTYDLVKYKVLGDDNLVFYDEWNEKYNVKVSRLSYGIPMGSDIEYLDPIMISKAWDDRKVISNEK